MDLINPNIFKTYDVRGLYPEELNEDAAFRIGKALVKYLGAKNLVVGQDARLSSPLLSKAVVEGIISSGCNVIYADLCTTPLFYFSVNTTGAEGGIMITGSHVPPQFNGLKIVSKDSVPIFSEAGLPQIKELANQDLGDHSEKGVISKINLVGEYINFLIDESGLNDEVDLKKIKKLNIVIDGSNGVGPLVLKPLLEKINLNYIPLYFEIDGSFPNHLSDISREENIKDLRRKVLEEKADLGMAFDGDADRLAVIDCGGEVIRADYILSLLFKYARIKNPKVVYDHRFSKSVKELFGENGFHSRTGHSLIKNIMAKNNGDIGGELSGHFFFKEMKYADSAVLAMLKILKILSDTSKPINELIKPWQKYYFSGEINIEISQDYKKLFEKIKFKFADGEINELDGITVEYWNPLTPFGAGWWFNLRPSNTEALLRLVVEAETKNLLDEKVLEIKKLISGTGQII